MPASTGRPAAPEVIWTRPERAARGPRPAHSRAEIAAAAVRIADAEGIDAVSMRRVAAEVGAGTMSLYNYVPRKEDLHELMVDAVTGEYELPEEPSGDWRADLMALARAGRDLLRRHPWVPRLYTSVHGFSPNGLRYLEHCLAALEGLDEDDATKMELLAVVHGTVMTYVGNEVATQERSRALPWTPLEEQAARLAYLTDRVGGGAYPRLAAALANAGPAVDMDAWFDRTIGRILDAYGRGGGEEDRGRDA
ncbi:TetR/AcrR family transcriptional regulator [Streptomyces sp. PA03-6a]|nr:TetR/AcrR family transcriptional regulator [Streptomyces sp. PA03-6a]